MTGGGGFGPGTGWCSLLASPHVPSIVLTCKGSRESTQPYSACYAPYGEFRAITAPSRGLHIKRSYSRKDPNPQVDPSLINAPSHPFLPAQDCWTLFRESLWLYGFTRQFVTHSCWSHSGHASGIPHQAGILCRPMLVDDLGEIVYCLHRAGFCTDSPACLEPICHTRLRKCISA